MRPMHAAEPMIIARTTLTGLRRSTIILTMTHGHLVIVTVTSIYTTV
jgi:hypothetical protein